MSRKGKLYLVPSSLGNVQYSMYLPEEVRQIIFSIQNFLVENEKSARAFLKNIGYPHPQSSISIHEFDKHIKEDYGKLLKATETGTDTALLSEAGCPAVADPGAEVVNAAHKKDIMVVPLTGPSSIILALMASGMNGQSFAFHGYLPKEKDLRIKKIKQLEKESGLKNQTQIFIETPYRNMAMLNDILQSCSGDIRLCIACDITLISELIKTKTVSEWKKNIPDLNKKPAVFLIGK